MTEFLQQLVNGTKPDLDSCYQIALARNRHLNGGFFTVDALIADPAGAPASSENVSAWAGRSGSVAVAVKVNTTPSFTVRFPIAANTGA